MTMSNTMSNATLERAQREVAMIEKVQGITAMPHIVQLFGYVSGRESQPDHFYGHAVAYSLTGEDSDGIKFWPGDGIRNVLRNVYVVDGTVYYVAGWQGRGDGTADLADDGYVLLHAYSRSQDFMPHRCVFLRTNKLPA